MSADLVRLARGGDRDAFASLVAPHRAELQLHCYRMLGSVQDAEDALQEVLLSAWLGLDGFESRASVRTWLYRIATNRCLNVLRSASRRPVTATPPAVAPPEPSRAGEVPWLQPYPDLLLDGVPDQAPGPDARYESREAVSLAFIRAMQLLPPNQRAVLLLRDVLGYRASETADLLSTSEEAVNSALRRARAAMAADQAVGAPAPPADSPQEQALVERFVAAFTGDDVDTLVALMTDDSWVRMPPLPFEYHGPDAARRFFASVDGHRRTLSLLQPIRANRQPAWGEYVRDGATGRQHLVGVLVVALAGDKVRDLTHFETTVAAYLGLPRTLD